jgi:hypothetical protein
VIHCRGKLKKPMTETAQMCQIHSIHSTALLSPVSREGTLELAASYLDQSGSVPPGVATIHESELSGADEVWTSGDTSMPCMAGSILIEPRLAERESANHSDLLSRSRATWEQLQFPRKSGTVGIFHPIQQICSSLA